MCRQWRGKVPQLVLVLVVLVLVLCGFGAVRCELPPWRPELSGLHRESRHRPLPPPPPRHHKPPPYHPGHRGLQPTPDDILALHPSHPLSFYSQRDGPPHGPHRRPPPHPAPSQRQPPPHPAPSQHQPPPHPAPSLHQPEFGPGPQHQPEFGPPHHTTSFAQAPLHHPEHQSEHQPEHQPEHEPDHEPEIQHGDHFHFRDFTLLHRQRHHETHQQDVHFEPESGCRINGKMYAPGQSWHLANCRRGTCVKFGHNYYVSEDGCSVKYNNANYACVIYQEKDRPYPDCCPYYRCNPEN